MQEAGRGCVALANINSSPGLRLGAGSACAGAGSGHPGLVLKSAQPRCFGEQCLSHVLLGPTLCLQGAAFPVGHGGRRRVALLALEGHSMSVPASRAPLTLRGLQLCLRPCLLALSPFLLKVHMTNPGMAWRPAMASCPASCARQGNHSQSGFTHSSSCVCRLCDSTFALHPLVP